MKRASVVALRSRGFDVGTVGETYPSGIPDGELLDRCRDTGRVVLTNDDDFVRLAMGRSHAGVILYSDQGHPPGEIVRGVAGIDQFLDPATMRDHVEWLENWR